MKKVCSAVVVFLLCVYPAPALAGAGVAGHGVAAAAAAPAPGEKPISYNTLSKLEALLLELQGRTCVPIDITIRIDRETGQEQYAHEIIPLYRSAEVLEGVPATELIDPVFTEAEFGGISVPVFLIPADYAAEVISAELDEALNGIILPAVAEAVFVFDLSLIFKIFFGIQP